MLIQLNPPEVSNYIKDLLSPCIITNRIRSMGEDYVFTGVCLFTVRGVSFLSSFLGGGGYPFLSSFRRGISFLSSFLRGVSFLGRVSVQRWVGVWSEGCVWSEGGVWSGEGAPPPQMATAVLRSVRILPECILVLY